MDTISATRRNGDNAARLEREPVKIGLSSTIPPLNIVSQNIRRQKVMSKEVYRSSDEGKHGHAKRYGVKKIMVADHSSSKTFIAETGQFFAMSSAHNGVHAMFPIKISSLQTRGWKGVSYSVTPETECAKQQQLPLPPCPRIHRGNYRRAGTIIRNKIKQWCLDNPGFSISKAGPGSRAKTEETKQYYKQVATKSVGERSTGTCLQFAIINAVARLCDDEALKRVQRALQVGKHHFPSIGSCQRVLQKLQGGLNFRKIKDPKFKEDKFKWLAERKCGIWLVRLRAGTLVDHCILVDGDRQEILDIEEPKPMHLLKQALFACPGPVIDCVYIAEVREVYKM